MTCAVEYLMEGVKSTVLSKVQTANRLDGWLKVVHSRGQTEIPERVIKSINFVYDEEDTKRMQAEAKLNEDTKNPE